MRYDNIPKSKVCCIFGWIQCKVIIHDQKGKSRKCSWNSLHCKMKKKQKMMRLFGGGYSVSYPIYTKDKKNKQINGTKISDYDKSIKAAFLQKNY